jgi:hypothetical protein
MGAYTSCEGHFDLRAHMLTAHPQFSAPYALNLHTDDEVARLHIDAANNFPPEPWSVGQLLSDGDAVTVLTCLNCNGDRFRAIVVGHRDIGYVTLRCIKCLQKYPVDYTDC